MDSHYIRWRDRQFEDISLLLVEGMLITAKDYFISSQLNNIDMAKKPFGVRLDEARAVLVKAQCFEQGAIELIDDFKAKHIDHVTQKLKVSDFESGVELVQTLVDNIRETSMECTGFDPAPEFGDSTPARILKLALGVIGLDLDKEIIPDKPV